jgi:hypothetical protein
LFVARINKIGLVSSVKTGAKTNLVLSGIECNKTVGLVERFQILKLEFDFFQIFIYLSVQKAQKQK